MANKLGPRLPATPGPAPADQKTPGAVASGNAPGSKGAAPAAGAPLVPAVSSMPLFGGFRGGRKRKDGLKPGSPEAIQADRNKDAKRKRDERAALSAAAQPSPLPAAVVNLTSPPAVGPGPAPVGALAPGPGVEMSAFVPWDGKALLPVFEQAIPLAEELALRAVVKKARSARLPEKVLDEIEKDSAWPMRSKKLLEESSAQLAAKYLNKGGISAEYQPEIVFGVALCAVVAGHAKVLRRLDKLIAAANAGPGAPSSITVPVKVRE